MGFFIDREPNEFADMALDARVMSWVKLNNVATAVDRVQGYPSISTCFPFAVEPLAHSFRNALVGLGRLFDSLQHSLTCMTDHTPQSSGA